MKERKYDLAACRSHLYYLRRSPTFDAYLARKTAVHALPEYKRLKRTTRAAFEVEMHQCSPVLAIDYSTGLHGWPGAPVANGYQLQDGFAVYAKGLESCFTLYNDQGENIGSKSASEAFREITPQVGDSLQMETIWINCPFDKTLNGKRY